MQLQADQHIQHSDGQHRQDEEEQRHHLHQQVIDPPIVHHHTHPRIGESESKTGL